jgi:hypothetical protein
VALSFIQLARSLMAVLLTNGGEWDDAFIHARTDFSLAADDHLVWIQSQCHAALEPSPPTEGTGTAPVYIVLAKQTAEGTGNLEALAIDRIAAAIALARNQHEEVIAPPMDLPDVVPCSPVFTPGHLSSLLSSMPSASTKPKTTSNVWHAPLGLDIARELEAFAAFTHGGDA